jgi:hypothetical protein
MLKLLSLEFTILIVSINMFTVTCDSSMLWLHVVQPNLTAGNGFIIFNVVHMAFRVERRVSIRLLAAACLINSKLTKEL